MAEGIIIHREGMPFSGTWQIRPPALAGITPVAVLAYCGIKAYSDGNVGTDGYRAIGMAIPGQCHCRSSIGVDGGANTDNRTFEDPNAFLYLGDAGNIQTLFETGAPTFVSGGIDLPILGAVNQPRVVFLFFYGDDWEVAFIQTRGLRDSDPVRNLSTGFTGPSLDNQILFNLPGIADLVATSRRNTTGQRLSPFGMAVRRGAAGFPASEEWGHDSATRDNWSFAQAGTGLFEACHTVLTYSSITNIVGVGDWGDDYVEFLWQQGIGRMAINAMVIATPTRRWWGACVDALTASGNWIVSGAPFTPEFALLHPSSLQALNTFENSDVYIGGLAVADANAEYSSIFSDFQGSTDAVVKTLENAQFIDMLQNSGVRGWSAPAGNVNFLSDGIRVDNVTVTPGHPDIARKWSVLLFEGVAGPPTVNLQIDDLRHAHALDECAVEASFTLVIDGLRHAHAVDDCAVELSEAISLLIQNLAHGRRLDEVLMSSEWTLLPESLRHAHSLDESAVYWRIDLTVQGLRHAHAVDTVDVQAAPEIVIDIQPLSHGRRLDSLVLTYETPISIDSSRHAHALDEPDVSALMGMLTALQATSTDWRINAGDWLSNPAGADLNWHVIDAVFDGPTSILGVDGARVSGNAGVRELTVLTFGAAEDGTDRVIGEIAELRVYNGTLTQAQRDGIVAELQAKWL